MPGLLFPHYTNVPANMGKRPSKRRKQYQEDTRPADGRSPHLYGSTPNTEESALLLVDQLYVSHTELAAALRLVGRQLLRFEKPGDALLGTVRKVLKRADHLQRMMKSLTPPLAEALDNASLDEDEPAQRQPMSQPSGRPPSATPPNSRLNRPHSLRVIKFPPK